VAAGAVPDEVRRLLRASAASLRDRVAPDGYAPTSLHGAYPGMYTRDSAVHALALMAIGEHGLARRVLLYLLRYGIVAGLGRAPQIVDHVEGPGEPVDTVFRNYDAHNPYPGVVPTDQPDGSYQLVWAAARYLAAHPDDAEFAAVADEQVARYADYYLAARYRDAATGLLVNPNLEHSRYGRYFTSVDLVTNVFASQALLELAAATAAIDARRADRWRAESRRLADAVHEHLTWRVDGRTGYGELYDLEWGRRWYPGYSWVNLATVAAEWFAADPAAEAATYDAYLAAAGHRWGRWTMLSTYDDVVEARNRDEIMGKGLAWEIRLARRLARTDRLEQIFGFLVERNADDGLLAEFFYSDGSSDHGNQEQLAWWVYEMVSAFPELLPDVAGAPR
jgi:hypothetical protein